MKKTNMFNGTTTEKYNEARVINGNPNGIINLNGTNHQWATTIYKNMKKRTWFTGQVSIVTDKVNYHKLTVANKRSYDLILAQLIADDSIQVNQLMSSFSKYITSPVVGLCLSVQSMEEGLHSESYAVMAEDIAADTERIFNMHLHDPELRLKNEKVGNMYDSIYGGDLEDVTGEDILLAAGANQILEELVFPGGFAGMLLLGEHMPGSAEFIIEIMKDETLSHVPLFMNIFRNIVKEEFDSILPLSVQSKLKVMISDMADAEKRWSKYALKDMAGVSDKIIDVLVETQANSVCKNLGMLNIYDTHKNSPLNKLLKANLNGGDIAKRTNFFEGNVVAYSKNSMIIDF